MKNRLSFVPIAFLILATFNFCSIFDSLRFFVLWKEYAAVLLSLLVLACPLHRMMEAWYLSL
jgi:hypothetical protein